MNESPLVFYRTSSPSELLPCFKHFAIKYLSNKAGYTAAKVACGWVGAVINEAGYTATKVACGCAPAVMKKVNVSV